MMSIEGLFFPANSSRRLTSTLTINSDGQVEVLSPEQQRLVMGMHYFIDLDISPRLGNTPRYIQFDNGDRFETLDNDNIDHLLKLNKHSLIYRLLHRLESHLVFVVLVTLITAVAAWGFVKYGVPASASLIARSLPVETSQYLGQGSLKILDQSFLQPSELDAQRKQALQELFKQYSLPYKDYAVKVLFRKSDEIGANAMALPDGHIIFTDEMIQLAQKDEELVAILGHEIGHLVHRHMLRRVIQDSMFTLVLVLVTGDVSSTSSIISTIPTVLLELAYSRKFELEADDFAFHFLQQNDLSPVHFAHIMQRLEKSSKEKASDVSSDDPDAQVTEDYSSYLSTHPATEQRIQRFLISE